MPRQSIGAELNSYAPFVSQLSALICPKRANYDPEALPYEMDSNALESQM
jgi:hypothetical protein